MPKINRYFQPKPYEGQLYTPPLEIIGKAMEISQKRHDINSALAEEMKNQYIPSLPQDRKRAKELEDTYNKKIDDLIGKYHGDLSQAANELNKLRYDIKKDFSPNGEAGAIVNNYNNYTQWLKNSQELIEKGKALGNDFNDAHQYEMSRYQGIGDRDPNTGSFRNFNPETLAEYVEPDSIIQDVYKNFKPEKFRTSRTIFDGNKRTQITEEHEGILPERLYPSFSTALVSNPKFMQYLAQKSKHTDQSLDEILGSVDQWVQQRAQDLSFLNKTLEEDSDYDKAYLIRLRQNLKDQSDKALLESIYQYEPSVNIRGAEPSTLNPEDWRASIPPEYTTKGMPFGLAGSGGVYKEAVGGFDGYQKDKNLQQALQDPKFIEKARVNKPLIDEVFRRQAEASPDFKKKYGKDKAWTDNFDKQIVKEFKTLEASHSRISGVRTPVTDRESREETLRRLAAELENPASVRIMEVGKLASQRADEVGLESSDIIDKKSNKLKTGYLAYAQPGGTHGAAGYIIRKGDKEYILVDQETDAYNASLETIGAMLPIMTGKSKKGSGAVKLTGDQYGIPELAYDDNYNEYYKFHLLKPGTNESTGESAVLSVAEFYELQKPRYRKSMGVGASKRSKFFFPYNSFEQLED